MITCDCCGIKINPDNKGFEGEFLEELEGAQIDYCDECAPLLILVLTKFNLNNKNKKKEIS
jgi:hypothetical protein